MAFPSRSDKPGQGERYGVAVNASVLELEHERETALDRVCEMGYARIEMAKADGDAQRIAGELAPLLWRAAYGRDRGNALTMACASFAAWLKLKPYYAEIDLIDPGLVHRFAQAVIQEWLSLRCIGCGGGGWEEVTATGKRVCPTGRVRNAPKAICQHCRGSGKPKANPKLRMRVLGRGRDKIVDGEYGKFWYRQFFLADLWLKKISTTPRDHLHSMRIPV